ncbi:MAG TPA: YqaE/Pmp3 family membrane protein [Mucilaginibacter sp.]
MIMRYFLCFLCPPLAIFTTGKMGSFVLNIILTLFFWIPGIIHAILVVNKFYDDRRHRQFMAAARRRY